MATTRAHTATVHTPIFKHAPSHRTDIYLSVQWRQFIHAYPQDKLASLKVMLFLTTTNRQIVVDTSIAKKDFKVPCQVIFWKYLSACSSEIVSASDYQWKQDKQLLLCRSHQSRFSIFVSFNQHFYFSFLRNLIFFENAVSSLFTFIPPTSPSPHLDLVR